MNLNYIIVQAGKAKSRVLDNVIVKIFPGRLVLQGRGDAQPGFAENLQFLTGTGVTKWESKFNSDLGEMAFKCLDPIPNIVQEHMRLVGGAPPSIVSGRFSCRSQSQRDTEILGFLHSLDGTGHWDCVANGSLLTFNLTNADTAVDAMMGMNDKELETQAAITGAKFDPAASKQTNLKHLKEVQTAGAGK